MIHGQAHVYSTLLTSNVYLILKSRITNAEATTNAVASAFVWLTILLSQPQSQSQPQPQP